MPSPNEGQRVSSLSLGRQSAAAVRRGEVKISDPIPLPKDKIDAGLLVDQALGDQTRSTTQATDGTWPLRSTSPGNSTGPSSEGGQRDVSRLTLNRESTGPSVLLSTMSSKTSLTQRKSGGFRATIRSLFGSKRHRSTLSNDRSYHISDPGNLVPIHERPNERHVTRTPSQPTPGVTLASALGSHSPFAPLESKRTESAERVSTVPGHRRRNTLPSIVFSDQDAHQIRNVVDRSTTKRAAGSPASNDQTVQMPKALKRRSRSADALTDLVASQVQSPLTWRQSLLDQPLPTYETKGGKKTGAGMSTTRSSRLNSTVSSNSLKPVQNFDFGLLGESLEERVKTLELKCVNFEYAIAGLQGYDVELQVPTSRPPKRRSVHDLFLETNAPPSSRAASGQGLTFLKSPTDTSSLSDEDRRQIHRSSAATIKPAFTTARSRSPKRSAAPSPSTINAKSEQYGDLLAMIKEERAARKQLEAQVLELQKQINAYATSQPSLYAKPSPESLYTKPAETRARPLHRKPAFPRRSRNNLAETSRFSVSDTEESDPDHGFHDVYETPPKNKYTFSSAEVSPRPTVEIF